MAEVDGRRRGVLERERPTPEPVIPIVTTMAKAYTRGRGFDGNEPNDDLAAVIATAPAARSHLQPVTAQPYDITTGPFSQNVVGGLTWAGPSPSSTVLNRYRVRAI